MEAMVVDKYKSVLLRWELKFFFHANFAVKKYAVVLSTNISALSRGHAKKKAYQGISQDRI